MEQALESYEYFANDRVTLYEGDCIEVMRGLPDASVDSVVTDPPYLLDFMGKGWDSADGIAGKVEVWSEALRVLKPGGHLLAFGGTRTWHRLASAIEDAGFEIRDSIAWMYGSGFPKSHDVSKGIDKAAGAEREVIGTRISAFGDTNESESEDGRNLWGKESTKDVPLTGGPVTGQAEQWQGWGTALKPAHEPIVVARKPLIGTVAANVLTHGTGALNIDGSRIGTEQIRTSGARSVNITGDNRTAVAAGMYGPSEGVNTLHTGRWPANVILDESQAAELDRQSGNRPGMRTQRDNKTHDSSFHGYLKSNIVAGETREGYNDSGGASRFFYSPKASKKERPVVDGVAHPTVKPLALMRYLCKLVTPPGGTILEPFAGSGTTIEAALNEGFNVIGIEMTDEYLPLIMSRIERYNEGMF